MPSPLHRSPSCTCVDEIDAAEQLWLRGRDDDAEVLLRTARQKAVFEGDAEAAARVEVAMAHFAIAIDEDERASSHLAAAERGLSDRDVVWQARAWLASSILERRGSRAINGEPSIPDVQLLARAAETRRIASLVQSELAVCARMLGDSREARQRALHALETAFPGEREQALAKIELALGLLDGDDADLAHTTFLEAISIHRKLGHDREEGRAIATYATIFAASRPPGSGDSPAVWLARAKKTIGPAATWRDEAMLRNGFRAHGRRLRDRAVAGTTALRIERFEQSAARFRASIMADVDEIDRPLGLARREATGNVDPISTHLDGARRALEQLIERSGDQSRQLREAAAQVVDLIETATVERDRMRSLVDSLTELDSAADAQQLCRAASVVGARLLLADNVVLLKKNEGGTFEAASELEKGRLDSAGIPWRSEVLAHLERSCTTPPSESPAARTDELPGGPVLVVAMRGGFPGVLYADKLKRSGRFSQLEHHLAQLFADYCGLVFSRLSALEDKRRAFDRLVTTLDSIRDGVLTVDHDGTVSNANTAAARMLRIRMEDLIQLRLGETPALGPLWELLHPARRRDGTRVDLHHGSFIVTVRPTSAGDNGVVATLIELDRARQLAQRVSAPRPRYVFEDILGGSAAVTEALHVARRASKVDANVLITGESGTGKELFAQALHTGGTRASEPFIGINCAAVPRELLEAELFGYERGAFTGARTEGHPGKFELVGGGTLLLDEVGDMPIDMQAKLLRVLQERVVVRLGGDRERRFEGRVAATTHRDLKDLVRAGRFRHDLLYRLEVIHIKLPPLRERGRDIIVLAERFVERFAAQQGKRVRGMSPGVQRRLLKYPWPGNARELSNVIEREVSLLSPSSVLLEGLQTPLKAATLVAEQAACEGGVLPMAEVERREYMRALHVFRGNVKRAAEALGVSRVTFYAKLRAWGRHPRQREAED